MNCQDLKLSIYKSQLLAILEEIYQFTTAHFTTIHENATDLLLQIQKRWQAETERLNDMVNRRFEQEESSIQLLDHVIGNAIESNQSLSHQLNFSTNICKINNHLKIYCNAEERKLSEVEESERKDAYAVSICGLKENLESRSTEFISKHDLAIMLNGYRLDLQSPSVSELPNVLNWNTLLNRNDELKMALNSAEETNDKVKFLNEAMGLNVLDSSTILKKRCEMIVAGIKTEDEYTEKVVNSVKDLLTKLTQFQLVSKDNDL